MSLAPDVVAEVERLRREEGLGASEVVNRLVRAGLAASPVSQVAPFRQRTAALGSTVPLDNVADVLDLLDDA